MKIAPNYLQHCLQSLIKTSREKYPTKPNVPKVLTMQPPKPNATILNCGIHDAEGTIASYVCPIKTIELYIWTHPTHTLHFLYVSYLLYKHENCWYFYVPMFRKHFSWSRANTNNSTRCFYKKWVSLISGMNSMIQWLLLINDKEKYEVYFVEKSSFN